MSQVS